MSKVTATPAALKLIDEITADHGPVMFIQSGGCCDGSSPMCYAQDDFHLGANDIKLGDIGGAPFYIASSQYEAWNRPHLVIDAIDGMGAGFSLDNGRGKCFVTRSEICSI